MAVLAIMNVNQFVEKAVDIVRCNGLPYVQRLVHRRQNKELSAHSYIIVEFHKYCFLEIIVFKECEDEKLHIIQIVSGEIFKAVSFDNYPNALSYLIGFCNT